MPASRSARAITLAPRSCPSRPGLAITTRIFWDIFSLQLAAGRWQPTQRTAPKQAFPAGCPLPAPPLLLDYRRFLVFAPYLAQRVAHFSHGGIGTHGLEEQRHRVGGASGPLLQLGQGLLYAVIVARLLQPV